MHIKELKYIYRKKRRKLNLIHDYIFLQNILNKAGKKFWETEPEVFDDINNVGLR